MHAWKKHQKQNKTAVKRLQFNVVSIMSGFGGIEGNQSVDDWLVQVSEDCSIPHEVWDFIEMKDKMYIN